jgi:tRNA A-37 threonylcarbamoyl transferase component Bud32
LLALRLDPKYEVVRKLREGGMGAIYLVRHRLLDELRVIKVLRSQLNTDQDLKQRFLREAKAAIQLRHPNIAQLYDFSVDEEGDASIVLEYIDGVTLEELGRRPEARDLGLDLTIAQQALRALGFLHRKGFVHRDIAPDNLMLTRDHEGEPLVKLIDLGIVKTLRGGEGKGTATSLYLGKPRYSSPEQLSSPDIDARSDIYSFGVMLYELITGCYPIRGHDLASLIAAHLHSEPLAFDLSDPEEHVPPDLRALLLSCMAKQPAERPASAEQLSERLAAVASRLPRRSRAEVSRLIASAREGARSWREHELADAGSRVLSALDRGDFEAARERLAAAAEKLGSEPELLELGRRVEERQRERQVADADAARLEQRLAAAEAALAADDVPAALSQITEALARHPDDARARELAARIDARRRADEERAARAARELPGPASPGPSPETAPAVPSWQDAPTAEISVAEVEAQPLPQGMPAPAPPAAPFPAAGSPRVRSPARTGVDEPAPARRSRVLPTLALTALAVVVVAGGWLLWRGMARTGGAGAPGDGGAGNVPEGYSEGLSALAARDPATAARKLREAITEDGVERRGYLPWFHLGQALVAAGECTEGLKALDASERQGALASSPEASMLPALRASCAAQPEIERQLRPVDEALALLDRQIAEVEGSRTASEVAAMWASRPQLESDFQATKSLVEQAKRLAARAREEHQLDLAFQAADTAADARAKLAGVLREAAAAPAR